MISEGSSDCWKFSFAIKGILFIYLILKYENHYFISQFYCFYWFFLFKKNAGLIVSIRFLLNKNTLPTPMFWFVVYYVA